MEKILVIVAHYDDAELMFGGIINHCADLGYKIETLVVTDGSSWISSGSASPEVIYKKRVQEQKNASKILRVSKNYNLKFKDGFIKEDEIEIPLLETIRKSNPTIILTHSPTEYHNDHKVVYQVVNRLCNCIDEPPLICNPFVMTNLRPVTNFKKLYFYARCSDIASKDIRFFELNEKDVLNKCEALSCYETQAGVINSIEKIKNEAKFYGGLVGYKYSEILIECPLRRYKTITSLLE